jgi:ABC-type transporter Mla subunit MlaD
VQVEKLGRVVHELRVAVDTANARAEAADRVVHELQVAVDTANTRAEAADRVVHELQVAVDTANARAEAAEVGAEAANVNATAANERAEDAQRRVAELAEQLQAEKELTGLTIQEYKKSVAEFKVATGIAEARVATLSGVADANLG